MEPNTSPPWSKCCAEPQARNASPLTQAELAEHEAAHAAAAVCLGLHVLGVTIEATADHYGAATIAAHSDQSRSLLLSMHSDSETHRPGRRPHSSKAAGGVASFLAERIAN
jgi:hypothetical protein